ncbi:hypothetical protein L207DRAFT_415671, partial [Hyaloscypha variabilis F]
CQDATLQLQTSTCIQAACTFEDRISTFDLNEQLCISVPVQDCRNQILLPRIIFAALTLPTVILRIYSRYAASKKIWWNDCAIVIASGTGEHIWDVDPREETPLMKVFLVSEIFYLFILAATKISILILYLRIFPNHDFRHMVWTVIGSIGSWSIVIPCLLMLQCTPFNKARDPQVQGKCLDINAIAIASSVVSMVQDLIILVMPIVEPRKLQMSLRPKLNVLAIFSLGAFVTVTSIVRLKYMVSFGKSRDPTYGNMIPYLCSMVESDIAIICACLPALHKLFLTWMPGFFGTTNRSGVGSTDGGVRNHSYRTYIGRIGSHSQKISANLHQYEMNRSKWS